MLDIMVVKFTSKLLYIFRKGGRPKNLDNESFPVDTSSFQRQVLLMLKNMRMSIQKLEKQQLKIFELLSKEEEENDFTRVTDIDELKDLNARLELEKDYARKFRKYLRAIGLSCENAKEHIFALLDALMPVSLQTRVNLLYGNNVPTKTYDVDILSLTHDLPQLLELVLKVMQTAWPDTSEKFIKNILSARLKQAKKRVERDSK